MTGIRITVEPDDGCHGHPHHPEHHHHDPQEVVPFEKEDDLPPKDADDDSRTRELIAQEERASNDYEQLADEADDEDTKEVYEDISDEEKVHAGELLVLLLKQDPKQREALEQGSEEVRELVGGESFREMFSKGRDKVVAKANGVSITKAKSSPKGKEGGMPSHTEGKKMAERELRRNDRKISQGMGHPDNPNLGQKSSVHGEQKVRDELNKPSPNQTEIITPQDTKKWRKRNDGVAAQGKDLPPKKVKGADGKTKTVQQKKVGFGSGATDPSKLPKETRPFDRGPRDTPNRKLSETAVVLPKTSEITPLDEQPVIDKLSPGPEGEYKPPSPDNEYAWKGANGMLSARGGSTPMRPVFEMEMKKRMNLGTMPLGASFDQLDIDMTDLEDDGPPVSLADKYRRAKAENSTGPTGD